MGAEDYWEMVPPTVAPLNLEREEHWRRVDNSVNAVSFGFVATAILISMFLVMAIFERFLRPRSFSANTSTNPSDLESHHTAAFNGKLDYPSPKVISLCLSHKHTHTHLFCSSMKICRKILWVYESK
ncbi:hypothetical protein PTKIN_Ptkin02bG0119500 [Pterospermum kingtungense]